MAKQDRHVRALAQIFRVLGDPTRLRIFTTLQEEELNVTQLCRKLRIPQPTVSHHLGILRMSGLVVNRRNGKEVHYSPSELEGRASGKAIRSLLNNASVVHIGPVVFGLAKR
jgi:DNA-binding transcriptional ArsR family regulator